MPRPDHPTHRAPFQVPSTRSSASHARSKQAPSMSGPCPRARTARTCDPADKTGFVKSTSVRRRGAVPHGLPGGCAHDPRARRAGIGPALIKTLVEPSWPMPATGTDSRKDARKSRDLLEARVSELDATRQDRPCPFGEVRRPRRTRSSVNVTCLSPAQPCGEARGRRRACSNGHRSPRPPCAGGPIPNPTP